MSLGGGGGGGGALEQIQEQLQLLEREKQVIRAEIQEARDEQAEIDEAVEAVESLEDGSTVQVPVGGGAYVRAEVQDVEEIVVGLGGGYAAEQDREGAITALEHKKEALDDRIDILQDEIEEVDEQAGQLEQRASQIQQQQMQQLQQQMQGQQGPGDQDDE